MYSLLPTPFHRLPVLSRELGIDLWCKRDDLTGFGFGGNKTRKLDFLLAEAQEQGATDLIAVGGVQSNFCRIAAAYAARAGLRCHLVLGGSDAHRARGGNLALDALFGAELLMVDTDEWTAWEMRASALAAGLAARGLRPYSMPIGGSTPTGALGYAAAMRELLDDAARAGASITTIVHASSSGGTQAGLLAGAAEAGWEGRIIGIEVAKSPEPFRPRVLQLAAATAERLGTRAPGADEVVLDPRWIGEAYATPSPAGREAQQLFARREGIVLDDVYTAKAAAGLIGLAKQGELARNETVVFLHTGGSPQFFSF
ncbi:MAG: pyridoxal-phosphate dependent enzyme [Ignavibacteria bacterium]|nr:pyridoxal-phosphate dependent enzyme [Ignavibacteria bacterium]